MTLHHNRVHLLYAGYVDEAAELLLSSDQWHGMDQGWSKQDLWNRIVNTLQRSQYWRGLRSEFPSLNGIHDIRFEH